MYAIIQDGGHQYRVEQGQRLKVHLRDSTQGDILKFEQVCLVGGADGAAKVGTPFLEGARVDAKVTRPEIKGKKIVVSFYRRRKHSRRKNGHRQRYTEIEITGISG